MAMNEKTRPAAISFESQNIGPRRPPNTRMVQNFHLVWLDGSMDEVNNDGCCDSMTKLTKSSVLSIRSPMQMNASILSPTAEKKTLL